MFLNFCVTNVTYHGFPMNLLIIILNKIYLQIVALARQLHNAPPSTKQELRAACTYALSVSHFTNSTN